jgi:hypothetical protein
MQDDVAIIFILVTCERYKLVVDEAIDDVYSLHVKIITLNN